MQDLQEEFPDAACVTDSDGFDCLIYSSSLAHDGETAYWLSQGGKSLNTMARGLNVFDRLNRGDGLSWLPIQTELIIYLVSH